MGSLHWARGFGQPGRAAGSLWGWAVSRLHLDWTTRFFQEDEETLVLTHRDELSRTYAEDNTLPFDQITYKATCADDTRKKQTSCRRNDLSLAEQGNRSASSLIDSPTLKETRATVISTGPRTTTITSAVSTADTLWLKNTTSDGKGKRASEMQGDEMESTSEVGIKGRSCRLAGENKENIQKHRLSKDGDKKRQGKETVEGTPPLCAGLEDERAKMSLADPCQGPNTGSTGLTLNPSPTITAWEAGWNVTNAIQGIFVLGLPFALVQSGYVGLVVLVLSAWVCNHTGRILVACLYEEDQSGGSGSVSKVRVRHSYQDIVEACYKGLWPHWPGLGGWMVNVAQVIELMMTCTLYLVVSTSLLSDSLSGMIPRSACSLVSLLFLLPCLLLTDLRPVSTLSLLCSLAHMLISMLVMLYCLSRASSWHWSCLSLSVDPEDFLVSVGVIIFSYTSQIFLPPLEGSMEDRGQFNAMLAWTHGAACIMKTMFALLAVLAWGAETSEVITDNLPSDLRPLVNLCLLAKALLSYPLPFYSAAEILQTCLLRDSSSASMFSTRGGRGVSRPALLVRGGLLMTSYLLALLVPRFSLLMGLTGSVTGAAMTLILPCLFHLRLRWCRLTPTERLTDVGILSLGVICSVSGVICSLKRLVEGL